MYDASSEGKGNHNYKMVDAVAMDEQPHQSHNTMVARKVPPPPPS